MLNWITKAVGAMLRWCIRQRAIWAVFHRIANAFRLMRRVPRLGLLVWPLEKLYHWLLKFRHSGVVVSMRATSGQSEGLKELIDRWGNVRGLVMMEIGSYSGESAEIFLKSGKIGRIYCIDPWTRFYDMHDMAAFSDMERVERTFDQRFRDDERVVKVKGTIETARTLYPSLQPDVIYVDGCHTYDGVKSDLTLIMREMRPRRFLCGHDYSEGWAGCKRAIQEVVGEPDAVFSETSWLKEMN